MNTRAILIGGIAASLVVAMWEMILEAILPDGAGLFGPPIAIGATVVRDLQGSLNPIQFDLTALVIGLGGHMMNSVILAVAFGLAVGRRGLGATALLITGIAWGAVVFGAMWFVVVPAIDPLVHNLNSVVFLVGHMMWGAALGLLWSRFASADPTFALRTT
jgi:hypothetical protein